MNTKVPNLNAPNVGLDPAGVQERIVSIPALIRIDVQGLVLSHGGFSRDVANFTTTDNRFITEWVGDGIPIPNSDFYGATFGWPQQYAAARAAVSLQSDLSHITPAYSPGDLAKITGILQTLKALSLMNVAVTHDTNGTVIDGVNQAVTAPPAPILCTKDAWKAIVALLDSGLTQLNVDNSMGLPVNLPTGFAAVSLRASPSTAPGSFAAFNRALAGKANFELAYAVTRSPGGSRATLTTPGSPDAAALARADSAIKASALYNPAALAPPAPGDFSDPLAVYYDFSGASGDFANPVNGILTTIYVMKEANVDIDPADQRRAKLVPNSAGVAGTVYAAQASPLTLGVYQNVASPMPIIRNEELVLTEAEVRLALGDVAGANTAINAVRVGVGGLPAIAPATYVAARDAILKELRASTLGEPGGYRTSALRDYGLEAKADTTWGATDTHATVLPVPNTDANARSGNVATVCP